MPRAARRAVARQVQYDTLPGAAGVPLVWAIDPHSRSAMTYRPDGSARLVREDEVLDAGEIVPDFLLPLATLFG
jgi:Uma2 family endonuclease